jgi:hypothetical protein
MGTLELSLIVIALVMAVAAFVMSLRNTIGADARGGGGGAGGAGGAAVCATRAQCAGGQVCSETLGICVDHADNLWAYPASLRQRAAQQMFSPGTGELHPWYEEQAPVAARATVAATARATKLPGKGYSKAMLGLAAAPTKPAKPSAPADPAHIVGFVDEKVTLAFRGSRSTTAAASPLGWAGGDGSVSAVVAPGVALILFADTLCTSTGPAFTANSPIPALNANTAPVSRTLNGPTMTHNSCAVYRFGTLPVPAAYQRPEYNLSLKWQPTASDVTFYAPTPALCVAPQTVPAYPVGIEYERQSVTTYFSWPTSVAAVTGPGPRAMACGWTVWFTYDVWANTLFLLGTGSNDAPTPEAVCDWHTLAAWNLPSELAAQGEWPTWTATNPFPDRTVAGINGSRTKLVWWGGEYYTNWTYGMFRRLQAVDLMPIDEWVYFSGTTRNVAPKPSTFVAPGTICFYLMRARQSDLESCITDPASKQWSEIQCWAVVPGQKVAQWVRYYDPAVPLARQVLGASTWGASFPANGAIMFPFASYPAVPDGAGGYKGLSQSQPMCVQFAIDQPDEWRIVMPVLTATMDLMVSKPLKDLENPNEWGMHLVRNIMHQINSPTPTDPLGKRENIFVPDGGLVYDPACHPELSPRGPDGRLDGVMISINSNGAVFPNVDYDVYINEMFMVYAPQFFCVPIDASW